MDIWGTLATIAKWMATNWADLVTLVFALAALVISWIALRRSNSRVRWTRTVAPLGSLRSISVENTGEAVSRGTKARVWVKSDTSHADEMELPTSIAPGKQFDVVVNAYAQGTRTYTNNGQYLRDVLKGDVVVIDIEWQEASRKKVRTERIETLID